MENRAPIVTGQSLLDRMEDLNRELDLQAGEADVTRGLRALNTAQDHFETLFGVGAQNGLGSHTGTVTTAASTEAPAWPPGLLRLDSIWFIDPDTSRPSHELDRIDQIGGHVEGFSSLSSILSASPAMTGRPARYYTNGTSIYWDPLPDGTHTLRWYGLQRQGDISASGTFAYDDGVAMPLAVFAVQILRRGLDDPIADYVELAREVFGSQITAMRRYQRQRAPMRQYRYTHET